MLKYLLPEHVKVNYACLWYEACNMELGVPYRVLPNILQQRQLTSYVWLIIK